MTRFTTCLCLCMVGSFAMVGCKKEESTTGASASTKPTASGGGIPSPDIGAAFANASYRSISTDGRRQLVVNLTSDSELEVADNDIRVAGKYTRNGETIRAVITAMGTSEVRYFKVVDGGLQTETGTLLYDNAHYEKQLLAGAGKIYHSRSDSARITAATTDISMLETMLEMFEQDTGRYPTNSEGLNALVSKPTTLQNWKGPYLKHGLFDDPWKHPYIYKSPGVHNPKGCDVQSVGPDGKEGGGDDITNWK